jgi:hypothetical protein
MPVLAQEGTAGAFRGRQGPQQVVFCFVAIARHANQTLIYLLLKPLSRCIYIPQDSTLVLPEATMQLSATALFASIVIVALLAIYVPTIYIRKTNKLMALLEKIEAKTRK